MSISTLLAVLTLMVTAPLLAYTVWRLWRLWHTYHNPVTQAHGITVTIVLVLVLMFGLVFLNNDMPSLGLGPPILDTETTKLITRSIVCGGGLVVALVRLRLLLLGRKR